MRRIAGLGKSGGTLDYVAAWFLKAARYGQGHKVPFAFVSTNSITQGEQVAQLWPTLLDRHGLEIGFAHQTFAWGSEARGKAAVHVIVTGLEPRATARPVKRLFSYPDIKGDPVETRPGAITPYLTDGSALANPHVVVHEDSRPANGLPRLLSGSQPIDGGHLIFDTEERATFLAAEPAATAFLRGGHPFHQPGGPPEACAATAYGCSTWRAHQVATDGIGMGAPYQGAKVPDGEIQVYRAWKCGAHFCGIQQEGHSTIGLWMEDQPLHAVLFGI